MPPYPYITERDAVTALSRGAPGAYAVVEAFARAHVARGTTPDADPLNALLGPDGAVLAIEAAGAAVPIAVLAAGAASALAGLAPSVPDPPTVTLPRDAVAGLLLALRRVAPDDPALAGLAAAAAPFVALLDAAREALPGVEARDEAHGVGECGRALRAALAALRAELQRRGYSEAQIARKRKR